MITVNFRQDGILKSLVYFLFVQKMFHFYVTKRFKKIK